MYLLPRFHEYNHSIQLWARKIYAQSAWRLLGKLFLKSLEKKVFLQHFAHFAILMRSIEVNWNKIYELTNECKVREFLGQQKLKKKERLISNRLENIHDLSMPDISTNISLSSDGKFLFILSAYSLRIRCYE